MPLLEENDFLEALGNMYEENQNSGSVWITFKRFLGPRQRKKNVKKRTFDDSTLPVCLVRASDGKNKISVMIPFEKASTFASSLNSVCVEKGQINTLFDQIKNE
eukprot:GHVL01038762.1.p1 GENE.GHVL01038762.1~~GHVL01038762.1.p1  ORF type:complete len:104 (+),score=30.13 GHVL01038762.1:60-371(+)